MANYVNFNNSTIRYTDDNGMIFYIPKTLGNVDYEAFLLHKETAEDRKAQAAFDAEMAATNE